MKPPYNITGKILKLVASISEKIGEINAVHLSKPPTELRKKNRIKSIHSSLEIEGNTLTIEQITAIIENKRVIGPEKDILEVKNAVAVYDSLDKLNPYDFNSFCESHGILMKGLVESAGSLRNKSVGIVKGSEVTHIAPPSKMIKPLMNNLFDYLKKDDDLILIKSCVFHYEMEFIHPFIDGNGDFWLDIDPADEAKAAAVVAAHNGTIVAPEPTIEQKLSSVGLSLPDLKAALGL
jgi:Fic family protein